MDWCVFVCDHITGPNGRAMAQEVTKAIEEAATLGRELAAAVPGHKGTLLMFRHIPRDAPAHVVATIVDRNGYAR